jgi:hypothetical protein
MIDESIMAAARESMKIKTGKNISDERAAGIAEMLLAGRNVENPAAYVRAAIVNDPDPDTRFLPRNSAAYMPAQVTAAAGAPADPELVRELAAEMRASFHQGRPDGGALAAEDTAALDGEAPAEHLESCQ